MKILSKKVHFMSKSEVEEHFNSQLLNSSNPENPLIKPVKEYCSGTLSVKDHQLLKEELKKLDLFDFEIYQLIDMKPKTLLCLQLVIEEMEERYTETQLEFILGLFVKYFENV